MRRFNVTGLCVASKHYMVDISDKLIKIKGMIDRGDYFTINRARQYGKTTTLSMLERTLPDEYIVASISFESFDDKFFESPDSFCPIFLEIISDALAFTTVPKQYADKWRNNTVTDFHTLGAHITKLCRNKKIILMIDEVDKSANNRVFLQFLGMLREKYLLREKGRDHTFHSVILAGVYNIKNLKLKMINEGAYALAPTEGKIYNSPWNIAANFKVDMSFQPNEIATMLSDYEADCGTGMDIVDISDIIYNFTSGYPFLVSRICQCIDEELDRDWTPGGVQDALNVILHEQNTLFDDIGKNLENYKDLYDLIYGILITGKTAGFIINDPLIDFGQMFGLIKNVDNKAVVSNKIFEIIMTNFFISKESRNNNKKQINSVLQRDVVDNGKFDMSLCLRKFAAHYAEIFNERDYAFLEEHGRLLFLTYLKPLINGRGFYHIESQFTDLRRMDIVVDYAGDQFIIELKIWHGESEHQDAYRQLLGYMESKNAKTGYLLTFDFRKGKNKQLREEWKDFINAKIFDVII